MVRWTLFAISSLGLFESALPATIFESILCPAPEPWDLVPTGMLCPVDDPSVGELFRAFRERRFPLESVAAKIAEGAAMQGSLDLPSIASAPFWSGTPVPMKFALSLEVLRISSIDQKAQTFKMHFSLAVTWLDCRTMHNCTGIEVLHDSPEFAKFWKPLYRLSPTDSSSTDRIAHSRLYLQPNGRISWALERTQTFACKFDFANMPLDEHECGLELVIPDFPSEAGFWVNEPARGQELATSEWEITPVKDWNFEVADVSTGLTGISSSQVKVRFQFKRKPAHMFTTVVIPAVVIYLVSWVGLWIAPAAVPARAALGAIPVLIIVNKQSALAASLPPISGATRIGNFMLVNLFFVGLHMLEFGVVEFGMKVKKHEKQDAESDGPASSSVVQVVRQGVLKVATHSHVLDSYLRWLSFLIYTLCCILVFLA